MPKYVLPRSTLFLLLAILMTSLLYGCGKQTADPRILRQSAVKGAKIAASAKSQIGRPYCSGGISPQQGFDCSGLVYWACARNGVSVPRVSDDQAQAGQEVSIKELLPGDIVVFKVSWFSYHTGIYIGHGRFVHSPKPRTRVRIDSLNHVYWKEHYETGRRVTVP